MKNGDCPKEPVAVLTLRCNQRCLFCSGTPTERDQDSAEAIRNCILANKDSISFEGGEPTLVPDLPRWVRFAKDNGTRDIILCTNAAVFSSEQRVKELLEAGITLFNVNFPAHTERLFDLLTQTKGQFQKRLTAIRNLIGVAGGRRVRLNMVVNNLNYMVLPDYAHFVRRVFPDIFYIEFNLVKVLGYVRRRTYLVPRLSDAAPSLASAMAAMSRARLKFITDGFPLCFMEGCEHAAIDAYKCHFQDSLYMGEKTKTAKCSGCSLGGICAGPRKDYVELYGDGELRPSRKDPRPIIAKIIAMGPRR